MSGERLDCTFKPIINLPEWERADHLYQSQTNGSFSGRCRTTSDAEHPRWKVKSTVYFMLKFIDHVKSCASAQECIGHMKHTKRLLIIYRAERKHRLNGQTIQYFWIMGQRQIFVSNWVSFCFCTCYGRDSLSWMWFLPMTKSEVQQKATCHYMSKGKWHEIKYNNENWTNNSYLNTLISSPFPALRRELPHSDFLGLNVNQNDWSAHLFTHASCKSVYIVRSHR